MKKNVAGTICLTIVFSLVFTVVSLLFIKDILVLLNTPDDIMNDAVDYVKIILIGISFTALYNMCANVLRAVGDSRTPLYCVMISVCLNVGLDLLFVKVFDWGIQGAATATVLAQALSGLFCLGLYFDKLSGDTAGEGILAYRWSSVHGTYHLGTFYGSYVMCCPYRYSGIEECN